MVDNEQLWTEYENHLLNQQLTKKRISKLRTMFNIVSRSLNLETAERKDIENFINSLNRNNFKQKDGSEYSGNSKRDMKKFLKQYFKHTKGKDEAYPPEVAWIKTRIAKDEQPEKRPVVELNDLVKLAQSFKKYEYKILTLLLFDSGFRIQEMMSVMKKDLTWDIYDEDTKEKCFWIKCNISKTFTRNIPIPLFTTELKSFTESSFYQAKKDDDIIFDIHYESYLNHLKEHSMKLFKLKITPHCLRHSSATYYAKKLNGNVPQLAQRFGWSFSAAELQTYVRESGAYNKEGAKTIFKNEVVKMKEDNEKLSERLSILEKYLNVVMKAKNANIET
jgi:integrase